MAKQPFHLGWFIMKGYGPKGWRNLWGGPNPHGWVKPDLLVHLAKELERAAFDYVMIEDFPSGAEKLVDIARAVTDMDASPWIIQQFGRLPEIASHRMLSFCSIGTRVGL